MAATDRCPTTDGGNHQLVNGDERAILDATIAAVPIRNTALGSEDDSHVVIGYRDGNVAGS
ncbi:hypothetical protein [Streptomyces sp. NPDC010273]|uniref:hypothetical protein n=1 Tax=Streptomyces sp. NPDC010273 TaxID=3364829 RepID=UPI0036E5CB69